MADDTSPDLPPVDPGFEHAVRCADCARSDSAAYDAVPVDHMPIPAEALTGFEDGVPRIRGRNRRSFIKNGAIGIAAVYGASKIDWTRAFEAARAEGAVAGSVLVCLYLNGGADGLQTFVPVGTDFAAYQQARPTVGRVAGPTVGNQVGTTVAPGTAGQFGWANVGVSGVGNNGQTVGFNTLWGNGDGGAGSDLAMFPAVNFIQGSSRSHFDSRDHWFAGSTKNVLTGWLGRWLDLYGSPDNPLQAVSISSNLSKQIRSKKAPTAAVRNLTGNSFGVEGVSAQQVDPNAVMGSMAGSPGSPGNEHLNHSRKSYNNTVRVARALGSLNATVNPGYPQSSLSSMLQNAAVLIAAGLGTRIVTIDWGSFDNHSNILAGMDPQLTTLSYALSAFKADLAARGVEQNVMTMVFTEFGRRIEQNGDGTDHGTGAPLMLMGSRVRGGLASDWPGIAPGARVFGEDLRPVTDPRSIYTQVMGEWLGGDPGVIMPGAPGATGRPILK
jgi:uncharacterized protein (DUF1501 family)